MRFSVSIISNLIDECFVSSFSRGTGKYNDGRAEHSDNDSSNNNMEVIFVGQSSSSTSNNNYMPMNAHAAALNNDVNSCKTLQRKLEMKVERAKRTFIQQYGGGGGDSIEPKQVCVCCAWVVDCRVIISKWSCLSFFSFAFSLKKPIIWCQSIDCPFHAIKRVFRSSNTKPKSG